VLNEVYNGKDIVMVTMSVRDYYVKFGSASKRNPRVEKMCRIHWLVVPSAIKH